MAKPAPKTIDAFGEQQLTNPPTSTDRRLWSWYVHMFLINFVEFSAESSRGVVLATLFLYNKSLGGDLAFMGLLTSVFSVGRLISSTVFGWMCDRYTFKTVYIVSSAICLIGNIIYLLADQHVANSKHLLAVSRFLVGFGAGNRSVCRANVAAITTVHQRLKWLTVLASVVFLGYALTPGLGSLVAKSDTFILGIHLNTYTTPGLILVVINVVTIALMLTIYDGSVSVDDGPVELASIVDVADPHANPNTLPRRVVTVGLWVFVFLNFNARGILSVFETVNIPLLLDVTGRDHNSIDSIIWASNYQFYLGLLGLISYFSIEYFHRRISDVNWVQLGFVMLTIGNALLVIAPAHLTFTRLGIAEVFVWSIGCPITTAVVVSAFSKLLGGRPQGTMMGLLGSAGSVSRIVLPLLPAAISSMTAVFWINLVLCIFGMALLHWYNGVVQDAWEVSSSDIQPLNMETISSEDVSAA